MTVKLIRVVLISLFCLAAAVSSRAEMPARPTGQVNDFAGILDEQTQTEIQDLIARVESTQGAQMAVVTVDSLDGLTVEEYANKLFNLWGVGHKGKDDGLLFLIAPQERKVRIEVGYGLEGTINDGKAGRILDEAVVPYFKAGKYPAGILAGSQRIAAEITQDQTLIKSPLLPAADGPEVSWQEKTLIIAFFGLFVTLGFMALGSGIRGNSFMLIWGAGFGGIPLLMSLAFGYAMHFPLWILPGWALVVLVLSVIFSKKINKFLEKSGSGSGSTGGSSSHSSGSSFGSSSSHSSGSSFSGGSSGGGGSSRSW